jgi:hypothetical protein
MLGCASVVGLFGPSSPSTVVKGVVAVVIDALNGVLRGRLFAHIGKKVGRTLIAEPSIANRDATPAVAVIHGVFGVVAPVQHGPVAAINTAIGCAVLGFGCRLQLVCHAAARLIVAAASLAGGNLNLLPAAISKAAKKPNCLIPLCFSPELNGLKKAVGFSGDIKSCFVGHGKSWLVRKDYMNYRTQNQQRRP